MTEGACDSIRYLNVAVLKRKLHALSFTRLRRELPPGGSLFIPSAKESLPLTRYAGALPEGEPTECEGKLQFHLIRLGPRHLPPLGKGDHRRWWMRCQPPRVILSGAKRSRTAKQQQASAQLGSRGNIEMSLARDPSLRCFFSLSFSSDPRRDPSLRRYPSLSSSSKAKDLEGYRHRSRITSEGVGVANEESREKHLARG